MISPLLVLYATTHQITLAGPILVTTVVGVAIFLVAVLLSPETKGKVLLGELWLEGSTRAAPFRVVAAKLVPSKTSSTTC
jgi:hypothetical protein